MAVSVHTHSWYSLLEGVSSPAALLERAARLGHTTLALTDTNNLLGAVGFVALAHEVGVRPLLGACLKQQRRRCVALIADRAGYRNLCRVLSRLHLQEQPDLLELLRDNADGLHVLVDDLVAVERLHEAFGKRLWLEIVRPTRSQSAEGGLLELGRRLGLQPVASTAAHLSEPAGYHSLRVVTAVRQRTLLERVPRRLALQPAHSLVDEDELRRRFRDLPEAVENTDRLAEQLRSDVLPHETVLPQPRLRRETDGFDYLRRLCERGLRRRSLGDSLSARQRLREELAIIGHAELTGYFLVVRDIARYARRQGHGMALRGSAGNSLVCYLLEITDVDPLRFGLPLERFLHPGRTDLPDIDLDFDWKVRDAVIEHVCRKYGMDYTARISSHLFLQSRSAFRESAKIHGLSDPQVSRLLHDLGKRVDVLMADADPQGAPATFPLEPERWPRLLADARRLLGRPHHLSIHPGGVVMTPRPMEEYAPLQWAPKGVVITQFDKDAVEAVGLVKIDLLGNRALATVDETRRRMGRRIDAPDHEPATVALLKRGDTLGVNQLESPAMRHLLIQMQPEGLEDVIRSLALIRPGAATGGAKELYIRRRRGLEPVEHLHPSLAPLLAESHGLMIYEDDALAVIRQLTGLPAPEADRFRKRVSRHRTDAEARALSAAFLAACDRRGIPRDVAAVVWVQLAKFNQYSFCKSHAVSYGLIAWSAAYLKTHHPLPFWTAALNNNQGMYPRRVYVEAMKRAGIAIRLPCVNRSANEFTVEDGAVRVGLGAIGSLDAEQAAAVLRERGRGGLFHDLADFRRRVSPTPDALALLVRCGGLDFTGVPRPVLFLEAELQDRAGALRDELFDPPPADWAPVGYQPDRQMLEEWRTLGFLVGPPMLSLFRTRLPDGLQTSRDLEGRVGEWVSVAGLVAAARITSTTDGRIMQFVTLEDEWGLVEVTIFPGACPTQAFLSMGPYLATGRVESHHGVLSLQARRFDRLDLLPPGVTEVVEWSRSEGEELTS